MLDCFAAAAMATVGVIDAQGGAIELYPSSFFKKR
jgi:hypothetical protein